MIYQTVFSTLMLYYIKVKIYERGQGGIKLKKKDDRTGFIAYIIIKENKMAYLWNSTLETGHKKIDEQHRQLFNKLNDINAAFRNGKGAEEIFTTLAFLTEYTVMHFATEEELMEKNDYPDYAVHKKNHDDFKATAGELTQKLRKDGPSEDFIVDVTAVIGDWLISHIRIDDIKMASYVLSNDEPIGSQSFGF